MEMTCRVTQHARVRPIVANTDRLSKRNIIVSVHCVCMPSMFCVCVFFNKYLGKFKSPPKKKKEKKCFPAHIQSDTHFGFGSEIVVQEQCAVIRGQLLASTNHGIKIGIKKYLYTILLASLDGET